MARIRVPKKGENRLHVAGGGEDDENRTRRGKPCARENSPVLDPTSRTL